MKEQKLEEIIKECKKILSFDPKNIKTNVLLGLTLNELNRFKEAITPFEIAIKHGPVDNGPIDNVVYYSYGAALNGTSRHNEGLQIFTKLIEKNFTPAYVGRAISLRGLGGYEEAIKDCDKGLELKLETEGKEIAYYVRGSCLALLGKHDEAVKNLNTAIKLGAELPKDLLSEFYKVRAVSLTMLGKYEEALNDTENAIGLNPAPQLRNDVLKARKIIEKALGSYRRRETRRESSVLEVKEGIERWARGYLGYLELHYSLKGDEQGKPSETDKKLKRKYRAYRVDAWFKNSIEAQKRGYKFYTNLPVKEKMSEDEIKLFLDYANVPDNLKRKVKEAIYLNAPPSDRKKLENVFPWEGIKLYSIAEYVKELKGKGFRSIAIGLPDIDENNPASLIKDSIAFYTR